MNLHYALFDNQYFIVFHNSLEAAFFVSLRSENAWFAAREFGGLNMTLITLAAFAGSMLGMIINYGFGFYLSRWRDELPGFSEKMYQRVAAIFCRWIFLLMAVPPVAVFELIPGFSLFVLINGAFRVPIKRALAAVMVGRILYYSYYLYYSHNLL